MLAICDSKVFRPRKSSKVRNSIDSDRVVKLAAQCDCELIEYRQGLDVFTEKNDLVNAMLECLLWCVLSNLECLVCSYIAQVVTDAHDSQSTSQCGTQ